MSRPRNMLVSVNGKVMSVPPSKLKASLASLASGGTPSFGGKEVGSEVIDLSGVTSDKAQALLARLFPVTVAPTGGITEIPAPVIDF